MNENIDSSANGDTVLADLRRLTLEAVAAYGMQAREVGRYDQKVNDAGYGDERDAASRRRAYGHAEMLEMAAILEHRITAWVNAAAADAAGRADAMLGEMHRTFASWAGYRAENGHAGASYRLCFDELDVDGHVVDSIEWPIEWPIATPDGGR